MLKKNGNIMRNAWIDHQKKIEEEKKKASEREKAKPGEIVEAWEIRKGRWARTKEIPKGKGRKTT